MSTWRAIGRFGMIGGVGFGIEAAVLTALTRLAHWTPWQARIPSFLTAVLATWLLNRTFTFAGRGPDRTSLEALSYAGIQVGGAGINLAIFALCLFQFPDLYEVPIVPLAIGAVGGFAFNFIASNAWLYARARRS